MEGPEVAEPRGDDGAHDSPPGDGSKLYWQRRAAMVQLPSRLFVAGSWEEPTSGQWVARRSPVDGRLLGDVAMAGPEDVDHAVSVARRCFDDGTWSRLAPSARGATLTRWAQKCEDARDELALLVCLEMGKPVQEARQVDVSALVKTLRWYGEACDKLVDEVPHVGPGALPLVRREPAGVVGAVVPWNFPLTIAGWKLAPALATGCSVVMKLAEQSPFSMLRVAELGAEAGLPVGALNVLNGYGPVAGRAVGEHLDVDVLTFTGSTEVGRHFQSYAATSNLKQVWLELGGKSANLIFPDADIERAANTAAWSAFYNQGEMCSAGSRLLVHERVHDEVLALVLEKAAAMQPGDPLDPASATGAMVSEEQITTVEAKVAAAQAGGDEVVCGGVRLREQSGGVYYAPTVVDPAAADGRLSQEEVFGPVLAISTFKDEADAVRLANSTRYGLAAGVWTNNLSRAHRVAQDLRVGVVWVNCYEEGDLTVPFGGVKYSGYGSDKSLHALDKFFKRKTVWVQL